MTGNFVPMVFAVLKDKGIDTKNMSVEEAIAKYNELVGKSGRYDVSTGAQEHDLKSEQKSRATRQSTKFAIDTPEAKAIYDRISKGNYYSIEELDNLPIFQEIEKEIVKARERNGKRLGVESSYTYKIKTPEREKQRVEWVENFLQGKSVDTLPKTPYEKAYRRF